MDDHALLNRWHTQRDAEAFRELVQRYGGLVYSAARRITGDTEHAQDIAQECFLKLSAARNVHTSLGGWLHRTATRAAINAAKSAQRRTARDDAWQREQSRAPTAPDTLAASRELETHVDAAIDTLPDELRAAVVAYYLEGQSQDAIAHECGVDRSTIARRLQRALTRIREDLARRGIPVAAPALAALLDAGLTHAAPAALTARLGRIALAGATGSARHAHSALWSNGVGVAAAVLLLGGIGFGVFRLAVTPDDVAADITAPEPQPGITVVNTAPFPETTTTPPAAIVLASATDSAPPDNSAQVVLRCMNTQGEPVAGAEVYVAHIHRQPPPIMVFPTTVSDEVTYYDTLTSDESGEVALPPMTFAGEYTDAYVIYARVPGELVGVWSAWSEAMLEASAESGVQPIRMVAAGTERGVVTVLPVSDPQDVQVSVMILRIPNPGHPYGASAAFYDKSHASLWPEVFTTTPNAQGEFEFGNMPKEGWIYLSATGPGLGELHYYNADNALGKTIEFNMQPEGVIEGAVTLADTGAPLIGATVHARPATTRGGYPIAVTSPFSAVTDVRGNYRLGGLPETGYSVFVSLLSCPPEYVPRVQEPITVHTGAATRVHLQIEHGSVVLGRVVGKEEGEPLGDVAIVATAPGMNGETVASIVAGPDGRFEIRLPEGVSHVYAPAPPEGYIHPEDQSYGKDVAVRAGAPEPSEIVLYFTRDTQRLADRGTATFRGRVVDSTGKPLGGVEINNHWKQDSRRQSTIYLTRTDDDGRFDAKVRAFGRHLLEIGGGEFSKIKTAEHEVDSDEVIDLGDFVIEKYSYQVSGTVLDPDGNPVEMHVGLKLPGESDWVTGDMSNKDGYFEFHAPKTFLELRVDELVRDENFKPQFQPVKIEVIPGNHYDITLEWAGDLQPTP